MFTLRGVNYKNILDRSSSRGCLVQISARLSARMNPLASA